MNLIDPTVVTAVGVGAGALAHRQLPWAMPRHWTAACALGASGAWAAVLLGGHFLVPAAGRSALLMAVPAGATAWVCALLGAVLALDLFHLLLRRKVRLPAVGGERRVAVNPAVYKTRPRNPPLANTSGRAGSMAPHKLPVPAQYGVPFDGQHAGLAAQAPRRPPKRVFAMAQGRKLARKRRVVRLAARPRARAGPFER